MAKRIFEAEISDELRMADAKGEPGGKRGLLFGKGGLQRQAVFHEVSDEELAERYRPRFEEERRRELSPEEKEFYGRLAELGFDLVCGAIGKGLELAKPRVERLVREKVVPRGKKALLSLLKKHGPKEKEEGEAWASKAMVGESFPPIRVCENSRAKPEEGASGELGTLRRTGDVERVRPDAAAAGDEIPQADLKPISRDDARERIARIMQLAQAVADECEDLSHCRLEDDVRAATPLDGLVGSRALRDLAHCVLNGEARFLPAASTDAFLSLLYSEGLSDRLMEIPLGDGDGSRRLDAPGHSD